MKRDRLPPAPTNTRLARLVRQIVDNMPWVLKQKLRDAEHRLARARAQLDFQVERNICLQHDIKKMLVNVPLPGFLAQAGQSHEPMFFDPIIKTCIHFEPVYIVDRVRPIKQIEIQRYTESVLREQSYDLARTIANRHADEIFSQTIRSYGIAKDRKHG